ncbi:MAG: TonB C-terminal domain-containing protein [Candidatus Hydrogenedens sp.]|nr:TonB C-terminal domain-containing protein [Candidatus Hydrogenedens sp.]
MNKTLSHIPDDNQYEQHPYWREKKAKKWLMRLIIFSVILHILVILLLGLFYNFKEPEVEVLMLSGGVTMNEGPPETPATPTPPPEPPEPPEPKPEPPKPPEPKPDPPKPIPDLTPVTPSEPQELKLTTGEASEGVPSELAGWVRLVQRKVEGVWAVPPGIMMDPANNIAEVSFWVDRYGDLIGTPVVTKHATDPVLGESGVNAIMLARPFPPLPDGYPQVEQLVVYAFKLQ